MGNFKAFCLPRATQRRAPKLLESVDVVIARMNYSRPPWNGSLRYWKNSLLISLVQRVARSENCNLWLKTMLKLSEVADVQYQNCLRKMHQHFQGASFEDSSRPVGILSGLRPANHFRQQLEDLNIRKTLAAARQFRLQAGTTLT
jgi:hypothetical protein